MALGPLIFLAVLALVHHPLMVSDDTDPATLDRLQQHESRLNNEMGRLQTEYNQEGWSWDPRQSREYLATSDLPAEDGTWDGWHYLVLMMVFIFGCCRQTMEKEPSYDSSTDGSSSTTATEDFDDTDGDSEDFGSGQQVLEVFYDQHIKMEAGDTNSMCNYITSFVNDLLEGCRKAIPYQNTLPLLENCIGVDRAFEGWQTQLSKTYTVVVPILPSKGHLFRIEASDSEGALSQHGHILVEMECVCKRERLLGDVICFLHHPEQELGKDKQGAFLVHVLCTSSHLDVEKSIRWFQELVAKAWKDSVHQKYNFEFTPQPSNTACRVKLGFQSGKSVLIDLVLGVQQGDSLVFFVSQDGDTEWAAGTIWRKTFAIQELLFFKWVSQRLPPDHCHLRCLQTLIFFKESRSSEKNPVLTNYHYKTCLMHLLLLRNPVVWAPENFGPALQELLLYMHNALQKKYLKHFLIGNIALPVHIPLPQVLRSATPPNLFETLLANSDLHTEAVKEFVEVVAQVGALWPEHKE